MSYVSVIRPLLAVLALLSIPLIAMQFTDQVNWGPLDFVFAGVLLFSTGLVLELILSGAHSLMYRAAAGIAVVGGLLLIWSNLAVGLIGSEDNPANVLYLAVLGVLLLGPLVARFKPSGMALTLFLAALVHALVPVGAALIWGPEILGDMITLVRVSAFFVVLFASSGLLFRWAGRKG